MTSSVELQSVSGEPFTSSVFAGVLDAVRLPGAVHRFEQALAFSGEMQVVECRAALEKCLGASVEAYGAVFTGRYAYRSASVSSEFVGTRDTFGLRISGEEPYYHGGGGGCGLFRPVKGDLKVDPVLVVVA